MIYIAHRGNLTGPIPELENTIPYINKALAAGYDVEVDVWVVGDLLFLGHDSPKHAVDKYYLRDNADSLWIHCKNKDALVYFSTASFRGFNFFWHEADRATLTSERYIWVHPGSQPIGGSIACLPEIFDEKITSCEGVCSDYIEDYRKGLLGI